MASYYFCHAHRFYENVYVVSRQEELIDEDGLAFFEGEPTSEIRPLQESHFPNFSTFSCKHDIKEKVFGRVFGRNFNYYLKPNEFFSFYNSIEELALFRLNIDASEDFVRTLNLEKVYKLEKIQIDFATLIPRVAEVSGLWISEIQSMNLSTAGYYGNDVHRNPEVQDMMKNGKISFIQIKYAKNAISEEYTIGISSKGAVNLYNKFHTISDELEIIMDIYEKLLKPSA